MQQRLHRLRTPSAHFSWRACTVSTSTIRLSTIESTLASASAPSTWCPTETHFLVQGAVAEVLLSSISDNLLLSRTCLAIFGVCFVLASFLFFFFFFGFVSHFGCAFCGVKLFGYFSFFLDFLLFLFFIFFRCRSHQRPFRSSRIQNWLFAMEASNCRTQPASLVVSGAENRLFLSPPSCVRE